MDTNLLNNLESEVALWPFIYDASVLDSNGKALLHTNPQLIGKQVAARPDFHAVTTTRFREQLRLVYSPAAVYDVSFPLQLNGAPFGTIHIGVSTVFLQSEITPRLLHAIYFSIASIFLSFLLAAAISNLALGPLKEINRNLDSVTLGGAEGFSGSESEHDEFGLVSSKSPTSAARSATAAKFSPPSKTMSTSSCPLCRTASCSSPGTPAWCWSAPRSSASSAPLVAICWEKPPKRYSPAAPLSQSPSKKHSSASVPSRSASSSPPPVVAFKSRWILFPKKHADRRAPHHA